MKRCVLNAWRGLAAGVMAEAADKSQYALFNPVPRPLMRPMEPDRPDATKGACTVDARVRLGSNEAVDDFGVLRASLFDSDSA